MTPVIPCSIGNIYLFPKTTTFTLRKEKWTTKWHSSEKSTKVASSSQRFLLYQSPSFWFLPKLNSRRNQRVAALETDVAVEEPSSVAEGVGESEDIVVSSDAPVSTVETTEVSTTQSKRPRPTRKSEMPPVKNEELVPGASFTGKVRAIQPFGAFIDFGAFTDGLVHVSRMSDSFVKDVNSVVSIGQEVTVRVVEANMETGRISLSMRENDDVTKPQQRKDTSPAGTTDKPRTTRRNATRSNQKKEETQKTSKFAKGQVLNGTVKSITRAGAFINLPEGEEGFLPTSEESEGFGNVMGDSSLQPGEEVKVRVLRINKGTVTLTMKKEENVDELNMMLNQGVVHVATNPFALAFRKNKDIATFLEERGKIRQSNTLEEVQDLGQVEAMTQVVDEEAQVSSTNVEAQVSSSADTLANEVPVTDDTATEESVIDLPGEPSGLASSTESALVDEAATTDEVKEMVDVASSAPETQVAEPIDVTPAVENVIVAEAATTDEVKEMVEAESSAPETQVAEPSDVTPSVENVIVDEAPETDELKEVVEETSSTAEAQVVEPMDVISQLVENTVVGESSKAIEMEEKNNGIASTGQPADQILSENQTTAEEIVKVDVNNSSSGEEEVQTAKAAEKEVPSGPPQEDLKAEPVPQQNGCVTPSGQSEIESKQTPKASAISPALVKQLREETGAGMMDCKKALAQTGGDIIKAQEFLRKKGLASAEKKASRTTAEGRIGAYVHDSRIGVLIEVNCETDFVSRGDIFKELVDDLAMQVAACPQVQYLATEDVPEEIVSKEREIEMQKEDLLNKPEQIRSRIVEGRVRKRLEEFALLEQPFIKSDKVVVKDWVKQTIATIGENIKVKRFVRYNLGEGLEKKSQDFAAEVAAQTASKPSPQVPKDESAAETKTETPEKPTVAISAALVKQLREETGAGMMDCKKALTETGGDLEKAQEYLRKKGLSSADKKSSRLAAEGRISSYIHDSRIGVLVEVNCETDFVGRSEKFKELVDDLAMQVVACPQVQYVSVEEIPESLVRKEKELEMQREDLLSKPENIREKIVEGRVSKRLGELALLEQPFIKDDGLLVKDLVKQTVAAIGENIKVRRFVRFTLGEATEEPNAAAEA